MDRMEAAVISPLSLSLSFSRQSPSFSSSKWELSLKADLGIEIESYRISQSHPLFPLVSLRKWKRKESALSK